MKDKATKSFVSSFRLKMLFGAINRTQKWIKTVFFSTMISLTVCFYLKIYQHKSFVQLFLLHTTEKIQQTYPCVSFCDLDLFDEFSEEPLKQNIRNLTRSVAHNYLVLWWNGLVCKETLLSINFTDVRARLRKNFVQSCIPSALIYKNCEAINKDAPWDYLEPLCYTLNIPQEYEDILYESLQISFAP